jgi:hypothetical protein
MLHFDEAQRQFRADDKDKDMTSVYNLTADEES